MNQFYRIKVTPEQADHLGLQPGIYAKFNGTSRGRQVWDIDPEGWPPLYRKAMEDVRLAQMFRLVERVGPTDDMRYTGTCPECEGEDGDHTLDCVYVN